MSAIDRSGHNAAWRSTLEMLTSVYSIKELNGPVTPDVKFSFLHEAVAEDAIVAVRVLLEHGVNVNQPTSDMRRTALHVCAEFDVSREM